MKKTLATAIVATIVSVSAFGGSAAAIPYAGDNTQPTATPTFNAYTGVPSVGDESDFLRGKVSTGTGYVNDVKDACANGSRYTLRVYVHNGASDQKNDNGNGSSVAKNTKAKVALPTTAASKLTLNSSITASNAATATDGMTIDCGTKKVTLNYVAGSAKQYTKVGGTVPLNDSIATTGAPIGTVTPNGDVWGCWDQRVWILLTVEVKDVVETPKPVETKPVEKAPVCEEIAIVRKDRTYTVTAVKTTLNGAKITDMKINFGEGGPKDAKNLPVAHTYVKDGTYTIKAVVTTDKNTMDMTKCAQVVNITTPIVPINQVTPQQPTRLVDAGPASLAGIFAAAVAAGTIGHRVFQGRRLSRQ